MREAVAFALVYHADIKGDIKRLDLRLKTRIKTAIETRLVTAPQRYGTPLKRTLKGYWKLRVGDYRVVYKIENREALVLGIIHRKEVYETIEERVSLSHDATGRGPDLKKKSVQFPTSFFTRTFLGTNPVFTRFSSTD